MDNDNDEVELIASGYEWECPECYTLNHEIEITESVTCTQCRTKYDVSNYFDVPHAYK